MKNPPSLNTKDIQALVKGIGLTWPKGRFFYCRYEDAAAGRRLLSRLSPLTSFHDLGGHLDVCVNAALTYAGLAALKLDDDILNSLPSEFCDGMRSRAAINGDQDESDPSLWEPVWSHHHVHLWIGVYTRDDARLDAWRKDFAAWVDGDKAISIVGEQDVSRLVSSPEAPVYIDNPASQPKEPVLLEHFGFRDGMGNPAIRGLIDKHIKGSGALGVDGQWSAIAPGEFLLGHDDAHGEIPVAPIPEAFAFNGSFMVLRKLAQNVDLFRDYMAGQAKKLGHSADDLATRMVGRHRDGKPLIEGHGEFDFTYAGDPEGRVCPMGAHMRRANPRDSFGAEFGSLLVDRHRILRRAITYGKLVERGQKQQDVNGDAGQGLIFIVLNASISRQFEFVQQQWINYGNDFNQGNDSDPITGLQPEGGQMVIPGDGERKTMICDDLKQFVTCRGGDYFFLPGINAFDALAGKCRGWRR